MGTPLPAKVASQRNIMPQRPSVFGIPDMNEFQPPDACHGLGTIKARRMFATRKQLRIAGGPALSPIRMFLI
jgi:hypothetical protein